MIDVPVNADLYFRPTGFVDAPFGLDGQVKRLAGGMLWFSAFDVMVVEGGRRQPSLHVPIERLDAFMAELADWQRDKALAVIAHIEAPRPALELGERRIGLGEPRIVGILNVTPDSFSDGGQYAQDPEQAANTGFGMAAAGAAIIDVGGESTRPGATDVWEGDEAERVVPVIERLARSGTAVSIDSRKASVMEAALGAGAGLVNDVSGLRFDERSIAVVREAGCPVIVMHHAGRAHELHAEPNYADPLIEVYDWLADRVQTLVDSGIAREKIVVDPGIGFGKALRDNLAILNGLSLFHGIGCPVMLGASRKRMIGALSHEAPADRRLGGSIELTAHALAQGIQLVRVHDVVENVQALHVWRGLRDQALAPTR